jgi:hypothetical protein
MPNSISRIARDALAGHPLIDLEGDSYKIDYSAVAGKSRCVADL